MNPINQLFKRTSAGVNNIIFVFSLLICANTFSQPVISSFSPVSGPTGTAVTITGSGFSSNLVDNIVYFGAVKANVSSATTTTLSVIVPPGASQQPLNVTVDRLTGYSSENFAVTFPGADNLGPGAFDLKIDSPTVLMQRGLAIGDYDGDGKPDLATVSNTNVPASYVAIHRNSSQNGSISFDSPQNMEIGPFGAGITAADFDGDGKLDIAASYIDNNGNVSIFQNNSTPGSLAFSAAITYSAGNSPYTVLARDIDCDGRSDLIISNFTGNSFSVLRNTSSDGKISFAPKLSIPTPAAPYSVAAGDLNNDGKVDIAVTNQLSNSISVFQNLSTSGNIQFGSPANIATPANPADLTIGDADGDGKPDIIFVNFGILNVSVLPNTSTAGTISFGTRLAYTISGFSGGPQSVAMNDIDGDAKPDLLVSGPDSYISVLENLSAIGSINFSRRVNCYAVSPFKSTAADFDLDDKPDIAVANSSRWVSVFRNRSNEPFIANFTPDSAEEGDTITIVGNNLATVNDIRFGNVAASSIIMVDNTTIKAVVGDGEGGNITVKNSYGSTSKPGFIFKSPPRIQSFNPSYSGTGDTITITGIYFDEASEVSFGGVAASWFKVNSSTRISAVVGTGASGQIIIINPYGSDTTGDFTYYPPPAINSFTPASGGAGTIITITGNNFTGASAVSIGGEPVISFTINSNSSVTATVGQGAFGEVKLVTPGGTATSSAAFNFPAPSINEIVPSAGLPGTIVTIYGSNFHPDPSKNIVFFGAAKATVSSASNNSLSLVVPAGTTYKPVTVTVNNYTAQSLAPYNAGFSDFTETISDSSFSWKQAFNTNEDPRDLRLADLDGDGKTEIISADYFGGTISVLKNTGTNRGFNFNPNITIAGGYGTNSLKYITVADLNHDGKPDIIIGFDGNVDLLINTSVAGNISFAPRQTFLTAWDTRGVIAFDFDGDSRIDIATVHVNGLTSISEISLLLNNGTNGIVTFKPMQGIQLPGIAFHLEAGDFDGDKKTDLVASLQGQGIAVLKNISLPGTISFDAPTYIPASITSYSNNFLVGDIDEDGKQDIVTMTNDGFKVLRNTTVGSGISFMEGLTVFTGGTPGGLVAGQLDGDGKVDMLVVDLSGIFLVKNTSEPGNFSFASPIHYETLVTYNYVYAAGIGDLDGDGKPDIAVANGADNKISLFRNQTGERDIRGCANTNFIVSADSPGTTYKWQVNEGNGFADIVNGQYYEGTNTSSLQIKNIPVEWDANQYRYVVDGSEGRITNIKLDMAPALAGKINTSATACVNAEHVVEFSPIIIPDGSTVQLWESINGAAFTLKSTKSFLNSPIPFTVQSATSGTVRYYFQMIHPEGTPCALAASSDTATITISSLTAPVITSVGLSMTLTNSVMGINYNWQVFTSGNWEDIPGETANTFQGLVANKYRVKASNTSCIKFSNELQMVLTAIDPVASPGVNIHIYPNPVTSVFIIDSLKLVDKWQTVEILGADGRKAFEPLNIFNRTRVVLNVEGLRPGLYFVILRKKNGAAALGRFVKQ